MSRPRTPAELRARVEELEGTLQALQKHHEELLERERAARAEAESTNRLKDEFLAILSHELRTPLNAIYGWARMLQSRVLEPERAARAIDVIARNCSVQVKMIEDLLDISRIVTGKMRLTLRPVDVAAVIQQTVESMAAAAEDKHITLTTALGDLGGPILADADRLQQAVWNLVSNAVKFTPERGRVEVTLRRRGAEGEIEVSDTGQGISDAALPVIFERLRQGDSSATRPYGGLGIGLSLVKHLVELHGGSVTARSAGPGRGSVFIIRLPAGRDESPKSAPAVMPRVVRAPVKPRALAGVRVVVVDGDSEALDLVETALAVRGARVQTYGSVADAWTAIQEWQPDAILSDLEMPHEDGYALARRVRALPADQGRTPLVALTAYSGPEDRARSAAAGFDRHLAKPVDPETLVATLVELVQK